MKKCFKCNEIKSLDQFYLHKGMKDGHLNKCVICTKKETNLRHKKLNREDINTYRRRDYRKNPEKYLQWRLNRIYGISVEDKENLLKKQNNVCAICKKPGELVVDHNHKSNKVRGLLHKNCNSAIGLLQDSPEIIISAAKYVEMDGI